MKLCDYYSATSRGDNSLKRTAMLNNAIEAGTLLIKKISKADLISPEKDGKPLLAWMRENGLNASPIDTVLSEHI